MRNLAVFHAAPLAQAHPACEPVVVDGVALRGAVVETPTPEFQPDAPENRTRVFVRVRGFSLNYRDRGFCYLMGRMPAHRFNVLGSELAGEVVAVGADVDRLAPGDRVISNHHYTGHPEQEGYLEGIISNHASREYQAFPHQKLLRIPDTMPDAAAGAFSINAQTAYSMVRRSGVGADARVLVTAARSNTSHFVIAALQQVGAEVYATTTSSQFRDRLEALGVRTVIPLARGGDGFRESEAVATAAASVGGFTHVFDPFFDVHLERCVQLMAPFGTYVTCGMMAQNPHVERAGGLSRRPDAVAVLQQCLMKNLSIIGNCIGHQDDLERALADYAAGRYRPVIDSVFSDADVTGFLNRTFNDRDRFGKVVFQYDA